MVGTEHSDFKDPSVARDQKLAKVKFTFGVPKF